MRFRSCYVVFPTYCLYISILVWMFHNFPTYCLYLIYRYIHIPITSPLYISPPLHPHQHPWGHHSESHEVGRMEIHVEAANADMLPKGCYVPCTALAGEFRLPKKKGPWFRENDDLAIFTGWWFGTFFFSHILGIVISTDFHIFERGWIHQPV